MAAMSVAEQDVKNDRLELVDEIIMALSNTVEAKDRYTKGHSQRVALYSRMIAERLGWSKIQCHKIYRTGFLHDIGKIRISDAILNKTGTLTEAEYESMKLHTLAGYYILKGVPSVADFAIGARWHHERFDGRGYPNGLSGQNIPMISRVISVADSYDAMTSSRSYRKLMPQEKVRSIIQENLGTQFDPKIGEIMIALIDEDKDFKLRQPDLITEYNILAIDDDTMSLKLLDFLLKKDERAEYKLFTATSGLEGLQILQEHHIDLVLLDVEMPGMDGFEVLSRIRSGKNKTANRHMPVIFMTGSKNMDIIQWAESIGVNDYLTKPVAYNILFASLENVLLSGNRASKNAFLI